MNRSTVCPTSDPPAKFHSQSCLAFSPEHACSFIVKHLIQLLKLYYNFSKAPFCGQEKGKKPWNRQFKERFPLLRGEEASWVRIEMIAWAVSSAPLSSSLWLLAALRTEGAASLMLGAMSIEIRASCKSCLSSLSWQLARPWPQNLAELPGAADIPTIVAARAHRCRAN